MSKNHDRVPDEKQRIDDKKRIYETAAGEAPHRIEVLTVPCGGDLAVIIRGGSKHHVGAAALAVSHPSLGDPLKTSATASVLTVAGHKEDELARRAALSIASALNCNVTVTIGIHLDNASEEDIRILQENCLKAVETAIQDQLTLSGTADE